MPVYDLQPCPLGEQRYKISEVQLSLRLGLYLTSTKKEEETSKLRMSVNVKTYMEYRLVKLEIGESKQTP